MDDYKEEQLQKFAMMFSLIKESESYSFVESLRYAVPEQYPGIFERYGIRWNTLVECDVNLILSGREPRYFLHEDRWIERYRSRHRIYLAQPDSTNGLLSWEDTFDLCESIWQEREKEITKWGISLWMREQGYACYNEMKFFYATDEWKDRAAAARYEWGYTCKRCGKKGPGLHVHHDAPIFTAYSPLAYRNFSGLRLSLYCQKCHDWFHSNMIRGCGYYGFQQATPEEMKAEREYFRKWRIAHDAMKNCDFCNKSGQLN